MFTSWNLVKPHHLNYFYPYDFKSMVTSYPSDCNLNPYFWPSRSLYIQRRHFNSPLNLFSRKCRWQVYPFFSYVTSSLQSPVEINSGSKVHATQEINSHSTFRLFAYFKHWSLIFLCFCHINIVSLSLSLLNIPEPGTRSTMTAGHGDIWRARRVHGVSSALGAPCADMLTCRRQVPLYFLNLWKVSTF
jgi:hypothetical protein